MMADGSSTDMRASRRGRLERRVAELRATVRQLWQVEFESLSVRFDLRGRAAGKARLEEVGPGGGPVGLIRVNREVLDDQVLFDDAMADTAPHEMAHLVVRVLAHQGRLRRPRPHGPEWRKICLSLGGSGRTTHNLPFRRARRTREYEYLLADGSAHWVGPVQHRRLQQGRARYHRKGDRAAIKRDFYTGRWRWRQ